jgi:hypothetical protein
MGGFGMGFRGIFWVGIITLAIALGWSYKWYFGDYDFK